MSDLFPSPAPISLADTLAALDCQISDVLSLSSSAQNLQGAIPPEVKAADGMPASDIELERQLKALLGQRKALIVQLKPGENISPELWQQAMVRTQQLLAQITALREHSRSQLQHIQRGQKSVQQYNKFR
uniref:hypothetical protein n=1 Tax=Thaumasiovibrio occultus TaxID=1891184 RepID=UPI000B35BD91|nr:hypothetical protein [Thaumasiovibrio occultus]